jgi:hypothetical protein
MRRACTKFDAICSHASSLGPRSGQCPAVRLRSTARPNAAKTAIGSALTETVGSGGRTAHNSAADHISCGHQRTIPSARSADMSSSASRANPSLSSRSSSTVRPSAADTGVRLPQPGRPQWPEDHQQRPEPLTAQDVAAVAPPTSTGRPVRHRLAPGPGCRCRPGPSAGLVGGQVDTQGEELCS